MPDVYDEESHAPQTAIVKEGIIASRPEKLTYNSLQTRAVNLVKTIVLNPLIQLNL